MSATASTAIVEKRAKPNMFQRIKAQNLLSFGPEGIDLELGPLNVLIGPNGSGKSNLLEVFSLFQAAPNNLAAPVRAGGGVGEWITKGTAQGLATFEAYVSVTPDYALAFGLNSNSIGHSVSFGHIGQAFWLYDERIWTDHVQTDAAVPYNVYQFLNGQPIITSRSPLGSNQIPPTEARRDESILSQRKDPVQYPELTYLGISYPQIRLYRDWQFGPRSPLRRQQSIDVLPRPLTDDYSNLWMFLSKLRQDPTTKAVLIEKIADIYEGVTDFELNFEGGTVQLYLFEGKRTFSTTRLSDGTLRYLFLMAILLDPVPPPLIALEEPELGMHPDLIHKIADLLIDASTRTQLVVTTHSEILVDALHERPEAVVVCEKHDGQTTMERLDASKLAIWLEKYRLGDLWTSGQLGGVRW